MSLLIIDPFRFGAPFASLYQSLAPLTVIRKQHTVEWFSGKALDSILKYTNIQNSPETGMGDAIDGGYRLVTGSGNLDRCSIGTNGIIHYSETASIIIINARHVSTNVQTALGFNSNVDANPVGGSDIAWFEDDTVATFVELRTHDRTTTNIVATDISSGVTTLTNWKVECLSSTVEGTLDGILKATSSSNLPQGGMAPMFWIRARGTGGKEAKITFWEAFNK